MTTVQGTKTKARSRRSDMTVAEFNDLYEVLQESTAVRGWIKRGRPERDVDCMEVGNTMDSLRFHVSYQKVRNQLMTKYGIEERELVSRVLHKFADSAG